jgi:hypothetical protein
VLLNLPGLFKELSLSARARTILIEALMISISSNHAKLKISTLCLAKALTNYVVGGLLILSRHLAHGIIREDHKA